MASLDKLCFIFFTLSPQGTKGIGHVGYDHEACPHQECDPGAWQGLYV